jgi:hypothetical protein
MRSLLKERTLQWQHAMVNSVTEEVTVSIVNKRRERKGFKISMIIIRETKVLCTTGQRWAYALNRV